MFNFPIRHKLGKVKISINLRKIMLLYICILLFSIFFHTGTYFRIKGMVAAYCAPV